MIRKPFLTLLASALLVLCAGHAQPLSAQSQIDRSQVLLRHNPLITSLDTLGSLTVGNGSFAFTVDATGLQSFPELYKNGVPLGTMSDWGWHSFPNTGDYKAEEVLAEKDFGRGHKELYSAQWRGKGRQKDAENYLRANPHRLHLGTLGLHLEDPSLVKNVAQRLTLETGLIKSRFNYDDDSYSVQTVCAPDRDLIASRIEGPKEFALDLTFAYPTGKHTDDGRDLTHEDLHTTAHSTIGGTCTITRMLDHTRYQVVLKWKGKAKMQKVGKHQFRLTSKSPTLELQCEWLPIDGPGVPSGLHLASDWRDVSYWEEASERHWRQYWNEGGFIDLGQVADSRALELERRIILSQYLMAVQEGGDLPPQETGLTYNSWFGKYHLEMTWWHLAQFALWGHPELLERPLSWYLEAAPAAREIARRQGFKGLRWMKMTDPSAGEAPSNVGSYLIWQQPHLIYLAELLYRAYGTQQPTSDGQPNARQRELLDKFGKIVDETAVFMADFAELDTARNRYILRGCIPAQETLKADSTTNPPFELSYWMTTLKMAQQWRERSGKQRVARWDDIIGRISPLAYNEDSLYLASETATQTYTDRRCTSDHPALLAAMGCMPASRLIDNKVMAKTLDWIWDNWNWPTSWGWDFPMTAMTCARLGMPDRAVDALLMPMQKNTYLVNGHNYQDSRLRLYLPGNGGLLTAVAMMAAGWDGATGEHPGFPAGWNVRCEGLMPMP